MGCDNVITINLSILKSTTDTVNETVCNTYTSPGGNYTWTTSGIYSDTMVISLGCDSVIFINLTVNTVNIAVTNNSPTLVSEAAGAGYQWIYCDSVPVPGETNHSFTAAANGNYAVLVQESGCIDTSACITVSNGGVNELYGNDIHIYTNPAHNSLTIDLAKRPVNLK